MAAVRPQAITGVVAPDKSEMLIRERWPSVARNSAIASLGRALTNTIILAPLAWLLMAGLFFSKLLPIVGRRYTLTNRRVMIRKGWTGAVGQEVQLADIDDVRIVTDANSDFFRAANIEIVSKGNVVLTLYGIPEADSFRHAILNARNAWVPDKAHTLPFIAAKTA